MTASGCRVVVVGQGYVGLPLAMRAVEVGFDVVGFEIDPTRVERLATGDSYVEDVDGRNDAGRTRLGSLPRQPRIPPPSTGFDVAVITVPTPLRETLPDLSHIESAARFAGHRSHAPALS